MKIPPIVFLPITLLLWAISCAPKRNPMPPAHNPMIAVWTGIRSDISQLAQTGKRSRWIEASEDKFPVRTSEELEMALKYIGDEDSDQKNVDRKTTLMRRLMNSDSCYWFGFECDHSIIVFFDANGDQTHCYPEDYAVRPEDAEQGASPNR